MPPRAAVVRSWLDAWTASSRRAVGQLRGCGLIDCSLCLKFHLSLLMLGEQRASSEESDACAGIGDADGLFALRLRFRQEFLVVLAQLLLAREAHRDLGIDGLPGTEVLECSTRG